MFTNDFTPNGENQQSAQTHDMSAHIEADEDEEYSEGDNIE